MFWSCLNILCPNEMFSFTMCQKGSVGHDNVVVLFFLIVHSVTSIISHNDFVDISVENGQNLVANDQHSRQCVSKLMS